MKQSRSSKYFLGLPLFCLASGVFAGPPVNYNGWSVADGVIDTAASCNTSGISCSTDVQDDGFLIETIETADYTYMRFVVTDPTATGATSDLDFAAETFIPFAFNSGADTGISQGIASLQVMREAATGFESSAELQRAMMRFTDTAMRTPLDKIDEPTPPEDMYSIKLSQTISDPTNGYIDSFDYTAYTAFATFVNVNPDSDEVIGRVMDITQRVDIGEAIDPASKQQFFQQKRRVGVSGNIVTRPSFAQPNDFYFVEGTPLSTASDMTLGGDTVSWADGDEIITNWVVQEAILSDSALSHQTIENRTTSTFASETDIGASTPVSPFDWDESNFGPTPTLP